MLLIKAEIGNLKGQFLEIYEEVSRVVEAFINEIDIADDFLY